MYWDTTFLGGPDGPVGLSRARRSTILCSWSPGSAYMALPELPERHMCALQAPRVWRVPYGAPKRSRAFAVFVEKIARML